MRASVLLGVVLGAAALIAPAAPGHSATAEPDAGAFVAHALALRAAGVKGEAAQVLADIPGAGRVDGKERLGVLWAPFFDNAIVKLGRLLAPAPAALYYNPLLDVALLTLWERQGERYRVLWVRALPGERLAEPGAEAPLGPSWMGVEAGPMQALAQTTAARLAAFRAVHPADSREPGRDASTFASAAADFRAALPRLVWNAAQRARWTQDARPWLRPALAVIEAVLGTGEAGALRGLAPETDAEVAAALAEMPAGFARGLALDMALDIGAGEHLLIGSRPEEGDVYVLVRCLLKGGTCRLRRFGLVSLLE